MPSNGRDQGLQDLETLRSEFRLEPNTPVTIPPDRATALTIPPLPGLPLPRRQSVLFSSPQWRPALRLRQTVKIRSIPPTLNALAASGSAWISPRVNRISKTTSRPSSKAAALSPALSPFTVGVVSPNAGWSTPTRYGRSFPACCVSAASGARRPSVRTTASPIRRMRHLVAMAGGSLKEFYWCPLDDGEGHILTPRAYWRVLRSRHVAILRDGASVAGNEYGNSFADGTEG